MSRLYADRADTKLATGIGTSDLSLSVLDGSVFPAPTGSDFAVLTLEEGTTFERVRLTARSGNTLTVTRAQDGTTAQSFTTAATVSLRPTASAMAGLVEKAGDTMTGPLAINGGTVTASAPLLDATQTWNAAGVAFTGLRVNVTDTASAAGSNLLDLQTGGVSRFRVDKLGNVSFAQYATLTVPNGAFSVQALSAAQLSLGWGGAILLSSGSNFLNDVVLAPEAPDTLAQRRTTNPQTFRVYNTWSGAGTNHERGRFAWVSNVLTIGTEKGGTGVARALELQTDGTTRVTLNAAGTAFTLASGVSLAWTNGIHSLSNSFGNVHLTVNSGTVYEFGQAAVPHLTLPGRLHLGGSTSSFPALKRNGAAMVIRLADDSANAAIESASVKTNAPTGGTAAEWKLGTVATVSPTSPNRTIEVEIGGTTFYIAAKTTND